MTNRAHAYYVWPQPGDQTRKVGVMAISGIISAIVVGLIVGALGRLVVPGRQNIPIWLTMVIGIIAALIGDAIAGAIGTSSFILTLIIQVVLAAVGVFGIVAIRGRGRSSLSH